MGGTEMTALWAWFIGTKVGRWIVGIGAVLAALAVAWLTGHHKGAETQAATDAKAQGQSAAEAAQNAVETYHDATQAAQQAQVAAAKQPAPDVVKRDDFDNTGVP